MDPLAHRWAAFPALSQQIALLLCLLLTKTPAQSAESEAVHHREGRPILLLPSRVFDSEAATIHQGWSVLVISNRIAAAGPTGEVSAPSDVDRIELPDMTLLPGLMDIHSHIFLHPYNEKLRSEQVLKEPVAYRSVEAVLHVKRTLLGGFTLLRDLGTEGAGFSDLAIKRAIEERSEE